MSSLLHRHSPSIRKSFRAARTHADAFVSIDFVLTLPHVTMCVSIWMFALLPFLLFLLSSRHSPRRSCKYGGVCVWGGAGKGVSVGWPWAHAGGF